MIGRKSDIYSLIRKLYTIIQCFNSIKQNTQYQPLSKFNIIYWDITHYTTNAIHVCIFIQ